MKYIITGSTGHISRPLTAELVKAGHEVSIITRDQKNAEEIKSLGADALVGSVEDKQFIEKAFEGADAVYLMIPQNFAAPDFFTYQKNVADIYINSIIKNNIKYVVLLSSIGAHMRKGAGPIDGLAYLEEKLESLGEVNALFLRPSYFYYNLYSQASLVKNAGIFGANHSGELVLTDTAHIARVAADALLKLDFKGHKHLYISSDSRTTDEIAKVLGDAIGKPGTPWVLFTDEQSKEGMTGAGLPPTLAEAYTQMGHSIHNGAIQEDYFKSNSVKGGMSLEEFAGEFRRVFEASV